MKKSKWKMRTETITIFCGIAVIMSFCLSEVSAVEGLVSPKIDNMVITVGGANADIQGYTSRAIQIALDALEANGGGTVKLGPGTYDIMAPVSLYSNITLIGSGASTILRKVDGFRSNFIIDADCRMMKVTVKNSSGFKVGMGVQIYDDLHKGCIDPTMARITSINGNILYIDSPFITNYEVQYNGVVSNSCTVVEGKHIENVRLADFSLDGNSATNDTVPGCLAGGIFLNFAKNVLIERVHVHHFNGDSFSWQVTENITVLDCEASEGIALGFHPGMGSDSTVIENCTSHHNGEDGIFLCWRVQNSVFRNNTSYANGRYGISIGHKDTDNLFEGNHVYENVQHGVYFRDEIEQNGGHRNTFRSNTIENNGTNDSIAYGFYIDGETHDILIEGNTIRSTGKGNQKGAVFIGEKATQIKVKDNTISGHPGISGEREK
jgi:hypothetical protein